MTDAWRLGRFAGDLFLSWHATTNSIDETTTAIPQKDQTFRRRQSEGHHRSPQQQGRAQGGSPAERDLQQRQLLEHRHRREGRHPDLQRRRRADAGLRGGRCGEQDHPGRHFRSAGSDRARQGAQRRARDPDCAGLRGPGVQGLARHRGHLRADLHPQGWQPLPGGRVRHGPARCAKRHHRLPADRHRQHRAQASRGGAEGARSAAARSSILHPLPVRIQHRRADDHRSVRHHHRRQQADGGAHRLHA